MEEMLYCFEVETRYKSGRVVSEDIVSKNEESMWRYYRKHHNSRYIVSSVITDVFSV